MTTPTAMAAISGGSRRPSAGTAVTARKTAIIGAATQTCSCTACTRSSPKRRKTPATMPMTTGIGIASMARRTQPLPPRSSMSTPVARKAPITSRKVRCPSAGPTSTEPGMDQSRTSGWR